MSPPSAKSDVNCHTGNYIFAAYGLATLAGVLAVSAFRSGMLGENLTRDTVRLALVWYAAALAYMLRLDRSDWQARTFRGIAARWCWSVAFLVFLIHVCCAFQFYHHWSHAEAIAHTRAAAGVGEGLYVNYLFTLVWGVDVFFWWLAPAAYGNRPAWIGRTLHAFMLFMAFNGAVIFASGPTRWVSLAGFVGLAITWFVMSRTRSELKRAQ